MESNTLEKQLFTKIEKSIYNYDQYKFHKYAESCKEHLVNTLLNLLNEKGTTTTIYNKPIVEHENAMVAHNINTDITNGIASEITRFMTLIDASVSENQMLKKYELHLNKGTLTTIIKYDRNKSQTTMDIYYSI